MIAIDVQIYTCKHIVYWIKFSEIMHLSCIECGAVTGKNIIKEKICDYTLVILVG